MAAGPDPSALLDRVLALREDVERQVRTAFPGWPLAGADPEVRASAANLVRYLALRRHDLHDLQQDLILLGARRHPTVGCACWRPCRRAPLTTPTSPAAWWPPEPTPCASPRLAVWVLPSLIVHALRRGPTAVMFARRREAFSPA